MSGEGGDAGSESGGGGKGGGGGSNDYGGFGGDVANYGSGPAAGSYGSSSNPVVVGSDPYAGYSSPGISSYAGADTFAPGGASAYSAGSSSGSGGLDDFIANPTGSNLSGPGPVGGDSGFAGAGGGSNTPMSPSGFEFNSPISAMTGDEFVNGSPTAAGGVFSSGAGSAVPYTTGAYGDAVDSLSGVSAPGGTSAASFAAPTGVGGNPDATTSVTNDIDKIKPLATGGAATAKPESSGILSSLGINNPASTAVAGVGLLNNLINGKTAPAGSAPLNANAAGANEVAAQQTSAGQALQQWQTTGTLPASYESQVQTAAQAARTRAISNAAAQGLPTDPTQNTALAQQLNAIDNAIPAEREKIASSLAATGQQMVNAGLQATGISSNIYQNLAKMEQDQNTARGAAIANFAGALNGGGTRGLTLKVA